MLIRTKTVLVSALLTAAPLAVAVTTISPAEATAKAYSSCKALKRDWPNGVAQSKAAADFQVQDGKNRPSFGPRARNVYAVNNALRDRDNDGTACETARRR